MNGWKILLNIIGAIAILGSGKFQIEIFGVIILIVAGFINKKKVIIRRIKG